MPRHKVFVAHHGNDNDAVAEFVSRFDDLEDSFIKRAILMPDDVIKSKDDEYVIRQIREKFLSDTTVTLVMIGRCTWSRQFVDWEVQASLRQPAGGKPNGLLAVLLEAGATEGNLPARVKTNVATGYAKFYSRPTHGYELNAWIEDAFQARDARANLIKNGAPRKQGDEFCL